MTSFLYLEKTITNPYITLKLKMGGCNENRLGPEGDRERERERESETMEGERSSKELQSILNAISSSDVRFPRFSRKIETIYFLHLLIPLKNSIIFIR